jgi:hypothetical protein
MSRTGCGSGATALRRPCSRSWPGRTYSGIDVAEVETLGITRLSRSQESEMAKDLDSQVEVFGPGRWTPPFAPLSPPTPWC